MRLTVPLTPDDTRHAVLSLPNDLSLGEAERLSRLLRAVALSKDGACDRCGHGSHVGVCGYGRDAGPNMCGCKHSTEATP